MYRTGKTPQEQRCCDPAMIAAVRAILEDYQLSVNTLALLESERTDRGGGAVVAFSASLRGQQEDYWRLRARRVCALVDSLVPCMEKMMLHYHYILGYTVEAASEALDVSRRTGFRLKKRGLELAAARYAQGSWNLLPPPPIPVA